MTRMQTALLSLAVAALSACAGGGGPSVGPDQPYAYDGYAFPNRVDPLYDAHYDFDYRKSVWNDHHAGGVGGGAKLGDEAEHLPDRPQIPQYSDTDRKAPEHVTSEWRAE